MTKILNTPGKQIGQAFVERHGGAVIGILHGWDRLRLQGTLRSLYYAPVMEQYLRKAGVLWKDFKSYAVGLTGRVSQAAEEVSKQHRRPMMYLASSRTSKEDQAWQIQRGDKIRNLRTRRKFLRIAMQCRGHKERSGDRLVATTAYKAA